MSGSPVEIEPLGLQSSTTLSPNIQTHSKNQGNNQTDTEWSEEDLEEPAQQVLFEPDVLKNELLQPTIQNSNVNSNHNNNNINSDNGNDVGVDDNDSSVPIEHQQAELVFNVKPAFDPNKTAKPILKKGEKQCVFILYI